MTRALKFITFLGFALTVASSLAHANERGTAPEAIAMVKRVKVMFNEQGAAKTIKAVNSQDPAFKDRDLYAYIYRIEGVCVAHGALKALVGKRTYDMQDADGKYLIREFIEVVKTKGGGWVDYKWPNPLTGKIDEKTSYHEKINDEYFVGVGIYKTK